MSYPQPEPEYGEPGYGGEPEYGEPGWEPPPLPDGKAWTGEIPGGRYRDTYFGADYAAVSIATDVTPAPGGGWDAGRAWVEVDWILAEAEILPAEPEAG